MRPTRARWALWTLVVGSLAACSSSSDYVGLTFEVVTPDDFDWSPVTRIAVELDDGMGGARAEAAVSEGAFEGLALRPTEPGRIQVARATLLDAFGTELAAGASPAFVPYDVPAVRLRVFVMPRASLAPVPGLLPEPFMRGAATALAGQYALAMAEPGQGPSVLLYDGLTHAVVPGVTPPPAQVTRPRLAEIASGTVLVLGDDVPAQLYVSFSNRWIEALLRPPHDGPTPGACVASLPGGGALVVGGRDADGGALAAVTRVGADGLSSVQPELGAPRAACRLAIAGRSALVLAEPGGTDPPWLYDVSTGESAALAGAGATTTAAVALPDGGFLLVLETGELMRLAPPAAGGVAVAPGDYQLLARLPAPRLEPELRFVAGLGGFVLGGHAPGGEALDGGVSFGVDVNGLSTVVAVPSPGAALASLPEVGLLALGGAGSPDRVMVLRP